MRLLYPQWKVDVMMVAALLFTCYTAANACECRGCNQGTKKERCECCVRSSFKRSVRNHVTGPTSRSHFVITDALRRRHNRRHVMKRKDVTQQGFPVNSDAIISALLGAKDDLSDPNVISEYANNRAGDETAGSDQGIGRGYYPQEELDSELGVGVFL